MQKSRVILNLLVLIIIPVLANAVSIKNIPDSPMLPGTKIVPGDASKNEFFIVAERDLPQMQQVIEQPKAAKGSEKNRVIAKHLHRQSKPVELEQMIQEIKFALKEAAARVHQDKMNRMEYKHNHSRAEKSEKAKKGILAQKTVKGMKVILKSKTHDTAFNKKNKTHVSLDKNKVKQAEVL